MPSPLLTRGEIARAAETPIQTVIAWMNRYGLFEPRPKDRPAKRPKIGERRYTVNNACVVRAIHILTTEGGIRARDAVLWCGETLPKHFEAILGGSRVSAVAEVRGIKLDLLQIVGEVRERLKLGAVQVEPRQPTEKELLAEVERVEQYMQSPEYRERLAAFRAKVIERGTPTNWQEAAKALGIPLWIIRIGLAAETERGRNIFGDLAEQIGINEAAHGA